MPSAREQWYGEMLRAGLETKVLTEASILAQATPSVLVGSLPKDVLTQLLAAGLGTGTVTPRSVLETATPDVLAAHIPHPLLWTCVALAAEQGGLTRATDGQPIKDEPAKREFLRRALESALAHALLTAKDVVDHVGPPVLSRHFPDDLNSKLLETSLAAGKLDAAMVVAVIGIPAMAKHAPAAVLWACLAQAGEKSPDATRSATTAPATTPVAKPSELRPAARPADKPVAERAPTPAPAPQAQPLAPPIDFEEIDTNIPIETIEFDEPPAEHDEAHAEAHPSKSRKSGLFGRLKRG